MGIRNLVSRATVGFIHTFTNSPIHLLSRATVEVLSQWPTLNPEFTLLSELLALAMAAPGYQQTFKHILYIAQQLGHFLDTGGSHCTMCALSNVHCKVLPSSFSVIFIFISVIIAIAVFRRGCMEYMQISLSSELGLTKPLQLREEPLSAHRLSQTYVCFNFKGPQMG